jgi:AraC family transcriptional regulator, positive regulator of tynA and feaB
VKPTLILECEQWLELMTLSCGHHHAKISGDQPFEGWVQPLDICGIKAADVGCNAQRIERTLRDVRLDGGEHFCVGLQLRGSADVTQNERVLRAEPGDVVVFDTSRPMQYHPVCGTNNLLSLQLPRSSCIAYFGFEPAGGVRRPGDSLAARLLRQVVECAQLQNGSLDRGWEPHFDMVVYDLVGALLGAGDWPSVSRHSDSLFQRICLIVERHFTHPDFGPVETAAEAGISLRYLQKLFTCRGSTCSLYIQSCRLERAFALLKRRAASGGGPSISEVAWASGFRDLNHFYRLFRQRFGHTPGATRTDEAAVASGFRFTVPERSSPHLNQECVRIKE